MSLWLRFVLAVLAVWRVTHLLVSEDGPADLIVRFRAALGESWVGKLLDCFYCLSLWIAAPAALFVLRISVSRDPVQWLVAWLAISGGACLVERAFPERQAALVEPLREIHRGETSHVLRTETIVTQQPNDLPAASPRPAVIEPERLSHEFAIAAGHNTRSERR
ncbi:MAG: DUF1360 domain-containing protein [Candidatus Sulfotelmatobacter sp.]